MSEMLSGFGSLCIMYKVVCINFISTRHRMSWAVAYYSTGIKRYPSGTINSGTIPLVPILRALPLQQN